MFAAFHPSVPVGAHHAPASLRRQVSTADPLRRRVHAPARRPRRAGGATRLRAAAERLLWATNLEKSHDGRTYQLRDASLTLHRGDKVAVLGPNGAGKSTLLSLLAGDERDAADAGAVARARGATLARVAQELPTDLDMDATVADAVLQLAARYAPTAAVRAALRHARAAATAERAGADASPDCMNELADAASAMDADPAAWQVSSYLATALQRLELSAAGVLRNLSGGQKRRVAIAAALVSRPDVLLLDEVTNHLSIEGIEYLEEMLSDATLTVLCISHDRYFVDAVCTTAIWELDDGRLRTFPPGYTKFLDAKRALLEQEERDTAVMQKALKKELEWMRRQPKARGTKSRSRTEDALRLQEELRDRVSRDATRTQQVRALQAPTKRLGGSVVELRDVTIRRGDVTVVQDFSYRFERGERVGIVGGNGVGKSSLLRAICGELPVDSGDVLVGDTVVFGHFDQDGVDIAASLSEAASIILAARGGSEVRVIDYVSELVSQYGVANAGGGGGASGGGGGSGAAAVAAKGGEATAADVRIANELERLNVSANVRAKQGAGGDSSANPLMKMSAIGMLDHFGFPRAKQHALVGTLSGGEKRRLQLMELLLQNPNFLLLDEVSNDLDVGTLTMLEEVLVDYSGVLLLCSHDRVMLDRLVDHLLVLEGGGATRVVEGKFTDYLAAKKEVELERRRERKAVAVETGTERKLQKERDAATDRKRKLSYKEKREYEGLEAEIDAAQAESEEISRLLETQAASAGYEKVTEWSSRLAELEEEVERKTERWMELAEIAE